MGLKDLRKWTLVALTLVAAAPMARADDLDVNGALRRYQDQQAVADQAKAASDAAAQRLQLLQGQLDDAQQDVASAQQGVQSAQSALDNLNRSIDNLQSDARSVSSQLNRDQNDLADAQRRLDQARRAEQQTRQRLQSSQRELGERQQELQQLKNSHAAQAQIDQKQQQVNAKQQEVDNLRRRLDQLQSEQRDCQSRADDLARRVSDEQSRLGSDNDQIASYDRQRDQTLLDLGNAQGRLSSAQSDVTSLGRQVSLAQSDANAAASNANGAQQRANDLYDYYLTVKGNYDRALAAVYATADSAAAFDGGREGQERAAAPGRADGQRVGADVGHTKGESDGDARDGVLGYRDGRANATTSAALAAPYAKGQADGAADATAKARAEDYPRGYNDALAARLAATPSQEQTVDATDTLPDAPGGNGPTLSSNPQTVGAKAAPSYPLPADQALTPPAYTAPGVNVPPRDNRYAKAPCDNLVLPEFTPLCRTRYDNAYATRYDASYRSTYLAAYQPAYTQAAKDAYAQALKDTHSMTYAAAQTQGAHDQGELDGFNAALAGARTAQYAAGKAQQAADFAAGHLLVVRSVELLESDKDGVLAPGEFATVKIVIDNYGGQASPKGKFRLHLTDKAGADVATYETRDLPSLAGDTRTTIIGLTRLKASQVPAGTNVTATGAIEVQAGAGYQTVSTFTASKAVHFPLELTDLALAKTPRVGEAVKATLTFKNLRTTATPATAAVLSTNPQVVTAAGDGKIQIPALEPGATATVDVAVTPTYWVGENTAVPFLLATDKTTQPFPKAMHVDRDASLLLFDLRGKPIPSSTVDVKAGSQVAFRIRFNFNATEEKGPFAIAIEKTSDPLISPANGSTTGIQLGYWSPGTSMEDTYVYFDVDPAMKGKQGWIMAQLTEGSSTIHALMLYVNVK